MHQRRSTGHSAHAFHRASAEVTDPDRHRESAGHQNRPVVGEVPAGARLGSGGKRQLQRRIEPESRHPRHRVGENVEHQRRRCGTDHPAPGRLALTPRGWAPTYRRPDPAIGE